MFRRNCVYALLLFALGGGLLLSCIFPSVLVRLLLALLLCGVGAVLFFG